MRKTVLITGATAGIGEATALLLSRNQFNLIITGRRNDRLTALKNKIGNETDADVFALNFDIRNRQDVKTAIESYFSIFDYHFFACPCSFARWSSNIRSKSVV